AMVPALAFMNCRLVTNIADLLADSYSHDWPGMGRIARDIPILPQTRLTLSPPFPTLAFTASSTFMPFGKKQVFPKRVNLMDVCGGEQPEGVRKMVRFAQARRKSVETVTQCCKKKFLRRESRCRSLGLLLARAPPGEEKDDGFEPARNADLAEDVLEVSFDRVAGETELIRHFFVGLAEHQEIDDFPFPRAQVQPGETQGRRGCRAGVSA